MDGFFNALSDFLKSDLAKGYGWVIAIAFFICVFIVGVIMYFIFVNLIVPSKTLEASEIKQANKDLISEIEELKAQKEDLEQKLKVSEDKNTLLKEEMKNYKFEQSLKETDDFQDKALESFIY